MIYGVYSSRDAKTCFGAPVLNSSDEFARRAFLNSLWSQRVDLARIGVKPEDFSLYKIGNFNDECGEIIPCLPVYIASGMDIVFSLMNPVESEVDF